MATKKSRQNSRKAVSCPVETTLSAIGGQWKVMVLDGTMRFGDLRRTLSGISARTLTKQLRELEGDGVIHRQVHQQIPPKVEYSLTPLGKRLKPVLLAMHRWGQEFERVRSTQPSK